jgi:hypothetical protein
MPRRTLVSPIPIVGAALLAGCASFAEAILKPVGRS